MGQERQRGEIQRLTEHFYLDEYGRVQFSFPVPIPKKGHNTSEKDSETGDILHEIEELPEPLRSQVKEDWMGRLAKAYTILLEIAQRRDTDAQKDASDTKKDGGHG